MLRKKSVATAIAAAQARTQRVRDTDRLNIIFIRILQILWKGNKIYEGLLF